MNTMNNSLPLPDDIFNMLMGPSTAAAAVPAAPSMYDAFASPSSLEAWSNNNSMESSWMQRNSSFLALNASNIAAMAQLQAPSSASPSMFTAMVPSILETTMPPVARKRASPPTAALKGSNKNLRFLVLVRVILKDLDRTQDYELKQRVKRIIKECNQLRRSSDSRFSSPPLQEQVEGLLKVIVGETRWESAKQRLDLMILQRKRRAALFC